MTKVFQSETFQNDTYQGPHAAIQLIFGTSVVQSEDITKTIKTTSED